MWSILPIITNNQKALKHYFVYALIEPKISKNAVIQEVYL